MFKHLFVCLLFSGLSYASFSQRPPSADYNPNAVHDRAYYLLKGSQNIVLPDSVNTILTNFAAQKNIPVSWVFKSSGILLPLYNNAVSKEDKLFILEFVKGEVEKNYPTLPISIYNDWYKKLNR